MHKEGYMNDRNELKLLLRGVRENDDEAFSKLLVIYEPLLLSMTSGYIAEYGFADEREDVQQELRVAFFRAAMSYDMEQSAVDFGFYAKVCLKNALCSRLRLKKGDGVEILPIDDMICLSSPDDPERGLFEKESVEALRRIINENLSEYEKKVWELYLDGKKPAQIAALLGKDAKSITNALSRIRAKLRALIGDIYNI